MANPRDTPDTSQYRPWTIAIVVIFLLVFVFLFAGGAVSRILREFCSGLGSVV